MDVHPARQIPDSPPTLPRKIGQWLAVVGAPIAWFLHQQTSYSLVPFAYRHGLTWAIHLSTVVFGLAAVACGLAAVRDWRSPRITARDAYSAERVRFMGAVGIMTSALFLLLILIQGLSVFIFSPSES